MSSLVDTNILVYRFDFRFPEKQAIATGLLRRGIEDSSLSVPHQALVEFVAVCSKPMRDGTVLLTPGEASMEAESLLRQFPVLYPDETVFLAALRGAQTYQLSWFDAHLWAFAECFGMSKLISEDFQDGRQYGNVVVHNPFANLLRD